MWSLGQQLKDLSKYHHLPHGYAARNGVKSLIPAGSGTVSVTMLKSYLFSGQMTLSSPPPSSGNSPVVTCTMYVRADGSGNWYFSAEATAFTQRAWQWAAGFIFYFSTDPILAHGYISAQEPDSGMQDAFTFGGKDPWIAKHWPQIFSGGCGYYVSDAIVGVIDTGQDDLPNTNNIATDHGFQELTLLPTRPVNVSASSSNPVSGGPSSDWAQEVGGSGQGPFAGGTGYGSPGPSSGDDDDDDDG
jgi:hypothetical protein